MSRAMNSRTSTSTAAFPPSSRARATCSVSTRSIPRRVPTITGGLTFGGGPGNNYVTHSIASMVDAAARRPERAGTGHRAWLVLHQALVGRVRRDSRRARAFAGPVRKTTSIACPLPERSARRRCDRRELHRHARIERRAGATDHRRAQRPMTCERGATAPTRSMMRQAENEELIGRTGEISERRLRPLSWLRSIRLTELRRRLDRSCDCDERP